MGNNVQTEKHPWHVKVFIRADRPFQGEFTTIYRSTDEGRYDIEGEFRIGPSGIEITRLSLDMTGVSPIDSRCMTNLRMGALRATIGREATTRMGDLHQVADLQNRALSALPIPENEAAFEQELRRGSQRDWQDLADNLSESSNQIIDPQKKKSGRPATTLDVWAGRTLQVLKVFETQHGKNSYPQLAADWGVSKETVRARLKRMRRSLDSKDNGTGWLAGSRSATLPGERLLGITANDDQ